MFSTIQSPCIHLYVLTYHIYILLFNLIYLIIKTFLFILDLCEIIVLRDPTIPSSSFTTGEYTHIMMRDHPQTLAVPSSS